jgi:hypothetical protein
MDLLAVVAEEVASLLLLGGQLVALTPDSEVLRQLRPH